MLNTFPKETPSPSPNTASIGCSRKIASTMPTIADNLAKEPPVVVLPLDFNAL